MEELLTTSYSPFSTDISDFEMSTQDPANTTELDMIQKFEKTMTNDMVSKLLF